MLTSFVAMICVARKHLSADLVVEGSCEQLLPLRSKQHGARTIEGGRLPH
jgi:hypothetical protein